MLMEAEFSMSVGVLLRRASTSRSLDTDNYNLAEISSMVAANFFTDP
jgi:hypothetical protein